MGDIIGSLFGAGADIYGGYAGADQALTGFNYLKNNPAFSSYLTNGAGANSQIAALLGLGGNQGQADAAFKKYLDSSGYNFQLKSGQDAITGSNAAKGLLNSGATGKALVGYGQDLASTKFNDYLTQLLGLSKNGLAAGMATGDAGTTGGVAGGKYITEGFNNASNAIGDAAEGGASGLFKFLGL